MVTTKKLFAGCYGVYWNGSDTCRNIQQTSDGWALIDQDGLVEYTAKTKKDVLAHAKMWISYED